MLSVAKIIQLQMIRLIMKLKDLETIMASFMALRWNLPRDIEKRHETSEYDLWANNLLNVNQECQPLDN